MSLAPIMKSHYTVLRPRVRDIATVRLNKRRQTCYLHSTNVIKQSAMVFEKCNETVDSINSCLSLPVSLRQNRFGSILTFVLSLIQVLGMTIKVIAFNVFCTFLFSGALFRRSLTVDQIFFDVIMNIVWNTKNFTFMFLVIYGGATLHKEVKL